MTYGISHPAQPQLCALSQVHSLPYSQIREPDMYSRHLANMLRLLSTSGKQGMTRQKAQEVVEMVDRIAAQARMPKVTVVSTMGLALRPEPGRKERVADDLDIDEDDIWHEIDEERATLSRSDLSDAETSRTDQTTAPKSGFWASFIPASPTKEFQPEGGDNWTVQWRHEAAEHGAWGRARKAWATAEELSTPSSSFTASGVSLAAAAAAPATSDPTNSAGSSLSLLTASKTAGDGATHSDASDMIAIITCLDALSIRVVPPAATPPRATARLEDVAAMEKMMLAVTSCGERRRHADSWTSELGTAGTFKSRRGARIQRSLHGD
ncbi:hypothetical protein AURDEDRAFT_186313 [Auricularia subglabra TFB-10046 SS5]|nr:hypothetical protein AURDEDRAFT_186313 [Auricularia subglabra TFB-10046 SS5]